MLPGMGLVLQFMYLSCVNLISSPLYFGPLSVSSFIHLIAGCYIAVDTCERGPK